LGALIRILLAVPIGAGIGVLSALWSFGATGGNVGERAVFNIDVDGWTGSATIGSPASDPYTRARIARRGLLAMARSEAIYFSRDRDQSGERLREECTYRIEGEGLPTRWWSVTLYAEDDYLAQNDDGAHSVSASTAGIAEDEWMAIVSPSPAEGPWLSTSASGRFSLTLRLYNPSDHLRDKPQSFDFPRVTRIRCAGVGDEAA